MLQKSFNFYIDILLFWGWKRTYGENRMPRNSILIPSHTNPTCSTVKLEGIITMSEFIPSAGQQLALLAPPPWLTHVAFSTRSCRALRTLGVGAT